MPPKRKHLPHNASDFRHLIWVRPKEFLAPLPVEECARRLQERNSYRTQVDLIRFRPGAFRYFVTRIFRRDLLWNRRISVRGTLEYWDEQSTLVKVHPDFAYAYVVLGIILYLPLILFAGVWTFEALALFLTFAFLVTGFLFISRVDHVDEQRALMSTIDDLLRVPVIFHDGAPDIITNDLTDPFYSGEAMDTPLQEESSREAGIS